MNKLIRIVLVVVAVSACEKGILGEEQNNNPKNNFDLFWSDFDRHYGLFEVRNFKWDSIYNTYEPRINENTTEKELWDTFKSMIEYLDDSHTAIFKENPNSDTEDNYFVSGFALNAQAENEWSLELLKEKYVDPMTFILEDEFGYGKITGKDIGYIYLGKEDDFDANRIEEVVQALSGYRAIILDMRVNGGGNDQVSIRIAGAFANVEKLAYSIQTRNGPKHNDFDEKTFFFTKPIGSKQYVKPVILLTDRYTISAGEILMLHMKQFSHVTQIGDTTAGDFSNISNRKFLPNGWSYQYSYQMYLTPEGKSLDGIGHSPDIFIKNTALNIAAKEDVVLEKAIEYLSVEYGIE